MTWLSYCNVEYKERTNFTNILEVLRDNSGDNQEQQIDGSVRASQLEILFCTVLRKE